MEVKFEEWVAQLTRTFESRLEDVEEKKTAFHKKAVELLNHLARSDEERVVLQSRLGELMELKMSDRGDVDSHGDLFHCSEQHFAEVSFRLGDSGLARNNYGFKVTADGQVDGARSVGDRGIAEDSRLAESRNDLRCTGCRQNVLGIPWAHGIAHTTDDGLRWEEKCVLDLLGDPAQAVRCHRCHFGTIQCKYYAHGFCKRQGWFVPCFGDSCPFVPCFVRVVSVLVWFVWSWLL